MRIEPEALNLGQDLTEGSASASRNTIEAALFLTKELRKINPQKTIEPEVCRDRRGRLHFPCG